MFKTEGFIRKPNGLDGWKRDRNGSDGSCDWLCFRSCGSLWPGFTPVYFSMNSLIVKQSLFSWGWCNAKERVPEVPFGEVGVSHARGSRAESRGGLCGGLRGPLYMPAGDRPLNVVAVHLWCTEDGTLINLPCVVTKQCLHSSIC